MWEKSVVVILTGRIAYISLMILTMVLVSFMDFSTFTEWKRYWEPFMESLFTTYAYSVDFFILVWISSRVSTKSFFGLLILVFEEFVLDVFVLLLLLMQSGQ